MIDITNDVIEAIGSIEGLEGKVYRRWPKKKVSTPAVLVSRVGGSTKLSDADGTEIMATLTYSIDINTDKLEDADRFASETADALSRYNLHRTGLTDFYDDVLRVYRVILTVSGTVDKRGNTFTH